MAKSILLISEREDTYEYLRLACLYLPVRVVHTAECHDGVVVARALKPSVIFIDTADRLSYNGWVTARLIKQDTQLRDIPVVILSDALNAAHLARKSAVNCQLPRSLPIPFTRKLIRECTDMVQM